MKLKELVQCCQIEATSTTIEDQTQEITAVTQDSRQVKPGSIFVAIKGTVFDGHDKIIEAITNGAIAVVVEKRPKQKEIPYFLVPDTKKALAEVAAAFYKNPSQTLQVVGVTGTNGKTTVTHLISQISKLLGHKASLVGTMYSKIEEKELPTINTTPDSLTLQRLLREMNDASVDVAALEVSSHGLMQERTWGIDFDVAVFTNLTQDHLDFHKTMDEYFHAKSLLFSQLENTYSKKKKLAVINCDSPYGLKLEKLLKGDYLSYGCKGKGSLQAIDIQIEATYTCFTLLFAGERYAVKSALIGAFNVYNLLAAIGAALGLGYELAEILEVVPLLEPVRGRFQLVKNAKNVTAIVDYAHTPDGLEKVLQTISKIAKQKVFCVVGCGGDRDKGKRPLMAKIAQNYADTAIFTMDNPRSENPMSIIEDMMTGSQRDNYLIEIDRKKAIQQALDLAEEGDMVLVAGKGHETYQVIGEQTLHFDDSEVIRNYQSAPITQG